MRKLAAIVLPLFLLASCGRPQEETPSADSAAADAVATAGTAYGSVAEVTTYLASLNPHIQRIGQLQAQYEEALAEARQEASQRKGTGRNLADKAAAVKPELQAILRALDAIEPPPLLAPFHRDTRKLVATRLEAYGRTVEGWAAEQKGDEFASLYRQAEAKLDEANQLIIQLNAQMQQINAALEAAAGQAAPGASS